MSTKFSKALAGVALFAFWTCTTSAARADLTDLIGQQILTMDGIIGKFELGYSGGKAVFTFKKSFTTLLNGIDIDIPDLPTTFTNAVLNKAPTSVPGGKTYTFSTTGSPITQTVTGLPLGSGFTGSATFLLTGVSAFVPDSYPNTLTLAGSMDLDSYASSIKFDGFGMNPSTFTFTLNMATGDFANAISKSIPVKGTASFSESDPPQAPEPSSVVLLASALLTGLCYRWRRLRRQRN